MKLNNRLATAAMESHFCGYQGRVTERYPAYVTERAKGGWRFITNEPAPVSIEGLAQNRSWKARPQTTEK